MSWRGHLWTLAPHVRHRLWPVEAPPSRPWKTAVPADQGHSIEISGALSPGSEPTAVVLVHGLSGNAGSAYMCRAARVVAGRGWTVLCLNLRGADGRGADIYHAGLTDDIEAALRCEELAGASRLFVWGFSLGGLLALHTACRSSSERLCGVVAVCPPLDLHLGAKALDAPRAWLYRRAILADLKRTYAATAERRAMPTPPSVARRARSIRQWDTLTVVPRFGFRDVDDYYTRASLTQLDRLQRPALVVASHDDPVTPLATLQPSLDGRVALLDVVMHRGGHCSFPRPLDVDGGVLDWMERQAVGTPEAHG